MKISLLVSTTDDRMPRVLEAPCPEADSRQVVVVNQSRSAGVGFPGSDMTITVDERGLSRSRNRAIEAARGDLCLICDNDIALLPGAERSIREAFDADPEADIITFQILRPDGKPYKRYASRARIHDRWSIQRVSSVEIAFRRESILKAKLRFDERFGLGAAFKSGEENVFLMDALGAGLRLKYAPVPIVEHEAESSGRDFGDPELLRSKGALFERLYGGTLGAALALAFAARKRARYRRHFSLGDALRLVREGRRAYLDGRP